MTMNLNYLIYEQKKLRKSLKNSVSTEKLASMTGGSAMISFQKNFGESIPMIWQGKKKSFVHLLFSYKYLKSFMKKFTDNFCTLPTQFAFFLLFAFYEQQLIRSECFRIINLATL